MRQKEGKQWLREGLQPMTWQMACHALTNWATKSLSNSVVEFGHSSPFARIRPGHKQWQSQLQEHTEIAIAGLHTEGNTGISFPSPLWTVCPPMNILYYNSDCTFNHRMIKVKSHCTPVHLTWGVRTRLVMPRSPQTSTFALHLTIF